MRLRSNAGRALLLSAALAWTGCRTPGTPPTAATPDVSRAGGSATLEVAVEGLASGAGRVAVALFDSAGGFAKGEPLQRAFLEIQDGAATWRLEDLRSGDYAVKVFHDENGNGVLDVNPLGIPSEPYGFSNDVRGRLGPPGWERARLTLDPGLRRIAVTVR